ncbi:MAG: tRNA preQ1(34) S-adenosylmethionine ribosyltransferase-isomerase QueA [Chloroflexi bacterium]|nr:tRNA preQ1(34) S-adenosylmethionine ribosyltransferase-isomerase QueA [Chloroflexota bacterium]
MKTSDFDYHLPPELIAQTPIEPRDASRLLVVNRGMGQLRHRIFRDIVEYLRPGDLLVGNNSRVIPARLHGVKPTGGAVEIFLLRPHLTPRSPSLQGKGGTPLPRTGEGPGVRWECLVGGKGLRPGVQVHVQSEGTAGSIIATILAETESGGRLVAFDPPVEAWLWNAGQVPLPPYIHTPLADPERYQTVYSRIEGSVASSTAGLHFTPELLLQLRERGVNMAFVTLHIGLDTFRPVQVEEIEQHRIHREWAELSAETALRINETRLAGGRVIAIGTTVVRTLESAAVIALGYRPCDDVPAGAVCGWQTVAAFTGETDLFIRPGYAFRAVDVMVTNFHLPRSTLLMLVSAFAGKELMDRAYAEAIRERYRFYSFGDAMLLV